MLVHFQEWNWHGTWVEQMFTNGNAILKTVLLSGDVEYGECGVIITLQVCL